MKNGVNIWLHPKDEIKVKPALMPGEIWIRVEGRGGVVLITMQPKHARQLTDQLNKALDADAQG